MSCLFCTHWFAGHSLGQPLKPTTLLSLGTGQGMGGPIAVTAQGGGGDASSRLYLSFCPQAAQSWFGLRGFFSSAPAIQQVQIEGNQWGGSPAHQNCAGFGGGPPASLIQCSSRLPSKQWLVLFLRFSILYGAGASSLLKSEFKAETTRNTFLAALQIWLHLLWACARFETYFDTLGPSLQHQPSVPQRSGHKSSQHNTVSALCKDLWAGIAPDWLCLLPSFRYWCRQLPFAPFPSPSSNRFVQSCDNTFDRESDGWRSTTPRWLPLPTWHNPVCHCTDTIIIVAHPKQLFAGIAARGIQRVFNCSEESR